MPNVDWKAGILGTAVVNGADQQVYQPRFSGVAARTNFDSGIFNVSPGQVVKGWVTFKLHDSIKIPSIQWNRSSGFSGTSATWTM